MTTAWQVSNRTMARDAAPVGSAIKTAGIALVAVIVLVWLASPLIGFETALTILTLIGFGGAVLGTVHPQVGLLAVGLLCTLDGPARNFLFTGEPWPWNTFNYWLLIVLVLFLPLVLHWRGVTTRLLQVLLAVLALGLVISPDAIGGVQHLLSITAVLALMVYFHRASPEAPVLYWLGVVCGVASFLGMLSFLLQEDTLPYFNPNALAYLPLTGLFAICLALPLPADQARQQTRLVLLAAANLTGVFLSHSRGGMLIGASCALFAVVVLRGFGRRVTAVLAAGLVAVAISVQFTDLQGVAIHRVRKLLDPHASATDRTSGRFDLLLRGWYIFSEHPWFGVGTGGFVQAELNLPTHIAVAKSRFERKAAHAGWIKMLAENGIPGGALLLGYVLSFAAVGWRTRDRELRRLGVLTTTVLGLAFVSTEFQSKGLWFLAAGSTVLLQRRPAPDGLPARRRA